MGTSIIATDNGCEMSYGKLKDFRQVAGTLLAEIDRNCRKEEHRCRPIFKTSESFKRTVLYWPSNLGRMLFSMRETLKILREKYSHWEVVDTWQTTLLQESKMMDQAHYFASVAPPGAKYGTHLVGNALSVTNTQVQLNMLCNAPARGT